MWLDLDHELQVTRWTIGSRSISGAVHHAYAARLDSSGDLDLEPTAGFFEARASATRARNAGKLACSPAARAGSLYRDRKQRLLKTNPAAPGARGTRLRARTRLAAQATAASTGVDPLVRDLAGAAVSGVFETNADGLANAAAIVASKTEGSQQVTEQILDSRKVEISSTCPTRPESGLAKTIEGRTFFGITQDLVGLIDLFEPRDGPRVVRILVRMVLGCEPAEGRF
jgi:hypothetical protein